MIHKNSSQKKKRKKKTRKKREKEIICELKEFVSSDPVRCHVWQNAPIKSVWCVLHQFSIGYSQFHPNIQWMWKYCEKVDPIRWKYQCRFKNASNVQRFFWIIYKPVRELCWVLSERAPSACNGVTRPNLGASMKSFKTDRFPRRLISQGNSLSDIQYLLKHFRTISD
jgi:hypothetical protein